MRETLTDTGTAKPKRSFQLRIREAVSHQTKRSRSRISDHAQLGMIPADQGLGAGQDGLFGPDIILGLEVDHEAAALQRRLEVLQQALAVQLGLVHLGIVNTDGLAVAAADRIRGRPGIVEAAFDLQGFVHIGVHAHAEPHAVFGHVLVHKALGGLVQNAAVVLAVGAVDEEGIRRPAALPMRASTLSPYCFP